MRQREENEHFLTNGNKTGHGSDLTVIHNLCAVLTALKQVLNQKSQILSRVAQISYLSQ